MRQRCARLSVLLTGLWIVLNWSKLQSRCVVWSSVLGYVRKGRTPVIGNIYTTMMSRTMWFCVHQYWLTSIPFISPQGLSEAMVVLLSLADKRQKDLTDRKRKEQILAALTKLKESLSPFSDAMKNYVRNPSNVPTQVSYNVHACTCPMHMGGRLLLRPL